ncbi:MAG: pilus assembly protein PilP [Dissulfurimicrobium sp.]|uniref:pilus assembly protein PilP n=1 Tax=Dissulfurimicrobium TaxID=1769732 RepID=UPI001EDB8B06|nr:pilus assembly protein PilP [Dissulfurimicrobium hydrothermale]UKL13085.1 pilus assembly protein PilP [Dissulfurimicrobium hydrothermale]
MDKRHIGIHTKGLLAVLAAAVCVWMCAGCESKPTIVVTQVHPRKASSADLKDMEERLRKLLAPLPYAYDPEGKPDPFQPFIRAQVAKRGVEKACATPLECMDLGQLNLTAIVTETGGKKIAMVQDASGKGYIIKRGVRIGYNKGVVKDILSDRVVVEEEIEDMRGRPLERERVLPLHPEGQ